MTLLCVWLGLCACNQPSPQTPTQATTTQATFLAPGQAMVQWQVADTTLDGVIWTNGTDLHVAVKDPMTGTVVAKLVVASQMISATDITRGVHLIALDSAKVLEALGLPQQQLAPVLLGWQPYASNLGLRIQPGPSTDSNNGTGSQPSIQLMHRTELLLSQTIRSWRNAPVPAGAFSHVAPDGFDIRNMEELGPMTLDALLHRLTEPGQQRPQSAAEASNDRSTRSPSNAQGHPQTVP